MLPPGDRCAPKMKLGQQRLNKSLFFPNIGYNDNPEAGVLGQKSAI
jgi:hypothetical protein